jgi:hypothetical protein
MLSINRTDTLGKDNERLRVINLQFRAKCEKWTSFCKTYKNVFIFLLEAEKAEDQSQDLNAIVAEGQG